MTKRFQKPTLRDLDAYAVEIGFNSFDGQAFLDHYDTVGWVVGRSKLPMKDWKAAVRTWRRNQEQWAAERASRPESPREKKVRLDRLDEGYLKEYSERIEACRSWRNNPDACPFGDPREEEAVQWRKAQVNFGHGFVRKLKDRLR